MRLKKREIPTSRREMNVQEGDGVKKRESPSERRLECMSNCRAIVKEVPRSCSRSTFDKGMHSL